MAELFDTYARGLQIGQQQKQRNQLAELQSLAPQVMGGNLDATSRAYALDPQTAQSYQTEGNRQQQQLVGLAKTLKQFANNPQMQAGVYRSALPYLKRNFGAEIPDDFDAASVMPIVDQVLAVAENTPSMGSGSGVQSTYVDDQGRRVAILRNGATQVLGGNDTGSNQQTLTIDVNGTPTQVTFDRRTGRYTNASLGGQGAGQVQQINGQQTYIDPSLPPQVQAALRAGAGDNLQDGGQLQIPQAAGQPLVGRRAEDQAAAIEAARLGTQQQFLPQELQARTQAALAQEAGKLQVQQQGERNAAGATRLRDAQETVSVLQEALPLLDTATGSGLGAIRDAGAAFVGRATDGAKANASLRVLATRLTAKVPRFEGPQSDKDVAEYKAAAGDLANESLPVEIRRAAGTTLQRLSQKAIAQAQAAGQGSGQPQGSAPRQIQSAEEYNALPPGALFIAPDGTQRRKR